MTYFVTKNYGPENGFSATFRQWRADSHCRFIHGYALGVEVTIGCEEQWLDKNGWVFNFGGLKELKAWLAETFDHKTLVALDDPALPLFREMALTRTLRREEDSDELDIGALIQMVEVERTGCEAFAKMVWQKASLLLKQAILQEGRVFNFLQVKVYEHSGNSATYGGSFVIA